MEIQDYLDKIKHIKDALPERLQESVYPEIAENITRSFKARIFDKGFDVNDKSIGNYSEKPITVSKKQLINKSSFVSISKNGNTMKLKGGYKELKQIQGLKSEYVNLVYSGELKQSIDYALSNREFTIGFSNIEDYYKASELETKFKKVIFQLSENEKLRLNKMISSALKNIQKKFFYAD